MSTSLRQRQPRSKGKAARVAEYIQGEVPIPQGRPAGFMLRKDDRKLAAIILSIIQAVWFVTISVGIIFYAGKHSSSPSTKSSSHYNHVGNSPDCNGIECFAVQRCICHLLFSSRIHNMFANCIKGLQP